jgi:hypothetical protein
VKRALIAVACTALLLAGCSAGPGSARGGAGAGAATPTSAASGSAADSPGVASGATGGSGSGADGTAAICAAAKQARTDAVGVFVTEYGKAVQAAAGGDQAAADTAQRAAKAALERWEKSLREQARRAGAGELGGALTEAAGTVATLRGDLGAVDDTALDRADERLMKVCG